MEFQVLRDSFGTVAEDLATYTCGNVIRGDQWHVYVTDGAGLWSAKLLRDDAERKRATEFPRVTLAVYMELLARAFQERAMQVRVDRPDDEDSELLLRLWTKHDLEDVSYAFKLAPVPAGQQRQRQMALLLKTMTERLLDQSKNVVRLTAELQAAQSRRHHSPQRGTYHGGDDADIAAGGTARAGKRRRPGASPKKPVAKVPKDLATPANAARPRHGKAVQYKNAPPQ